MPTDLSEEIFSLGLLLWKLKVIDGLAMIELEVEYASRALESTEVS